MSHYKQNKLDKPPKDQSGKLNSYARLSGIALQMVVIICLGAFTGVKLDECYVNDYNLYTVCFTLGSVIIAMVYVIKRIIAASKKH